MTLPPIVGNPGATSANACSESHPTLLTNVSWRLSSQGRVFSQHQYIAQSHLRRLARNDRIDPDSSLIADAHPGLNYTKMISSMCGFLAINHSAYLRQGCGTLQLPSMNLGSELMGDILKQRCREFVVGNQMRAIEHGTGTKHGALGFGWSQHR